MKRIALLGRDIEYSKSPVVHAAIGKAIGEDIVCDLVSAPSENLRAEIDRLLSGTDGFFVTKPYKTAAAKLLSVDLPAVNVVRKDGSAINTDGTAFIRALDNLSADWRKNVGGVLVLGAGGGARAVTKELIALGKKVYVLNRSYVNALRLCAELKAELYTNQPAEMVVNCTPLGRNGEDALYTMCVLPRFDYAFDLVYSNEPTPFLRRLQNEGAVVCDGRNMLVYQAIEGDMFLFGYDDLDIDAVFDKTRKILEGERR